MKGPHVVFEERQGPLPDDEYDQADHDMKYLLRYLGHSITMYCDASQ